MCDSTLWKLLSDLVRSAANLKVLIFTKVFGIEHSESKEFQSMFQEAVPIGLVEQLMKIQIRNFCLQEYEFKLVEYILLNGKSLKNMALGALLGICKSCKRILSFNRCSEKCKIDFRRNHYWITGNQSWRW